MNKTIFTIDQLAEIITPIARKYELNAVYIFGSYARGEATPESDIDVLIDKDGTKTKGLYKTIALQNDLEEATGKHVDLVTANALKQRITLERMPCFIAT
ncbi:MAG: nucleotidyltransferase family protein [Eubacteriaceae bacterium]|nr:nucleotidyltransferase family protein [Eubacteriaceae bacterium]